LGDGQTVIIDLTVKAVAVTFRTHDLYATVVNLDDVNFF
jgi:hypothetical protein